MRKQTLLLALFFPILLTAQQEFAPLGTKWYYWDEALFPPNGQVFQKGILVALDKLVILKK